MTTFIIIFNGLFSYKSDYLWIYIWLIKYVVGVKVFIY
jgi:hypothetical protein